MKSTPVISIVSMMPERLQWGTKTSDPTTFRGQAARSRRESFSEGQETSRRFPVSTS
jgi:hypothetical protein